MATPNNLTPTNCSWWPISALESDAAKLVEAPDAPAAASHAHWPKESLVLYHWTQSFSSQKVERGGSWGAGVLPAARSLGGGGRRGLKGSEDLVRLEGRIWGFGAQRTGDAGLLSQEVTGPCLGPQEHRP